jgi:hypothetical protein
MSDRPYCICGRRLAVWQEATFATIGGRTRPARYLCHDCAVDYACSDNACTLRVLPYVIEDKIAESKVRAAKPSRR